MGTLTERETLLLGAVSYWCEGARAKPWKPHQCRVKFINSDPGLIRRWWAAVVGVPFEKFSRPTLKTHNPSTVLHNTGDPYRGCLVVDVLRSRELYWRIEGLMRGIADATTAPVDAKM